MREHAPGGAEAHSRAAVHRHGPLRFLSFGVPFVGLLHALGILPHQAPASSSPQNSAHTVLTFSSEAQIFLVNFWVTLKRLSGCLEEKGDYQLNSCFSVTQRGTQRYLKM